LPGPDYDEDRTVWERTVDDELERADEDETEARD
jgi:hypothetical protein